MAVGSRCGTAAGRGLDVLLETAAVELVSLKVEHAYATRHTWRRFGKGNHPPPFNLGDCFAYALAKTIDEPLLFTGEDFARTDVEAA